MKGADVCIGVCMYVRLGMRTPVLYSTSLPHMIRVDVYAGTRTRMVIDSHHGLFYAIYISTQDHPPRKLYGLLIELNSNLQSGASYWLIKFFGFKENSRGRWLA
jgi:hypothetical protein